MKNFIKDLEVYNELPQARQMEMTLHINEMLPSVPVILGRAMVREAIKNMLKKQMAHLEQNEMQSMRTIALDTREDIKEVVNQ